MIKFKPVAYLMGNLRAVQVSTGITTSSIREGHFCYVSSTSLNKIVATPVRSGLTLATIKLSTGATIPAKGKFFPVYAENQDIENVGATITYGQYVTAFNLTGGEIFEVHKTAVHKATLKPFTTIGGYVVIGTSGKCAPPSGAGTIKCVIGECLGTFNSTWLRVRVI